MEDHLLTDYLVSAAFFSCPLGGAVYDKEGRLEALNKAMYAHFSISDKQDFLIFNLFDNLVMSAYQRAELKNGNPIRSDEPVPFRVEPNYKEREGLIGYTLWLEGQDKSELNRENKLLMGQLSESRMLMSQALEEGKLAAYSFSFDRFNTCDKQHCNRCFQFYGKTNTLLDKNRFICRALSSVRKPEDSRDFFYLFNLIHDEKLPEDTTLFHLKGTDGNYKKYIVTGRGMETDSEGFPHVILGSIIEKEETTHKPDMKELNVLKSNFLDNMNHEIRTPLNAIVGFSDILVSENDSEVREQYIHLIKENNDLLLNLVNDVLDMSRIENGMVAWSYEETYLSALMHAVYENEAAKVPDGVQLILDPSAEMSACLDKFKLMRIFSKLIDNAIKYTKAGEIHFGYQSACPTADVQFYVSDTGCGIPRDKIECIFDRFAQLNPYEQGVGLGLAICKGWITEMGGTISVSSREGEGSTFSFKLPIAEKTATT
ncbi:MAG: HAMP domain-containing sensor histidine kinase [Tannerellaceae bacterium]